MEAKFIERRKEARLPYPDKVIFTDGTRTITAHAANISRGGIFVASLDAFPLETIGHLAFLVPSHGVSLCIKAKVAHIVFDRQRCEVECGMGFQFMEMNKAQKNIVNLHIVNEQTAYLELREILKANKPDARSVERLIKRLPWLEGVGLLALRYKVNRICAIFDAMPPSSLESLSA